MGLVEIRAAIGAYASGFDPSRITAADAAWVVRETAAMAGMLAALGARAASRAAESVAWQATGSRSPAEQLAREAGISTGQAYRMLDTGRQLEELPEVRAAAARGELSAAQTTMVADAAAVDPDVAGRLLEVARSSSLGELRAECLAVKAAADADLEARRARIHAARSLRTYTDRDGTGHLRLTDNPERIAEAVALLAPARDDLFRAARTDGRRERADALDDDALIETLRRGAVPAPAAVPPPVGTATPAGDAGRSASGAGRQARRRLRAGKVLCRVDWDTLLRGYPAGGEVCEVMGQPVAVSAVQDMLAAGGFLAAVVTKGRQVIGVAHLGRAPTAFQDSALEWLYPACAARGCGRRARLERDHRADWATGRITLLDQLDLLCTHHHQLKTRQNWALVPGHGTREFVPPGDTRHPRHTSPAA